MIEEADFQKVGNAAIDLCVFVDKLRLGEKHREEADKLTHNVLNLIKRTEKTKEEPLTKGNKMKKLKIQFWKAEKSMAIQVLEYSGLANIYDNVLYGKTWALDASLNLNVFNFNTNAERDAYLKITLNNITKEFFNTEPRIEECGNVVTYTWEEK